MEKILYDKEGSVAKIVFNNPEKFNAIDLEMTEEFRKTLLDVENDPEIYIVVLTGQGNKAFCVGADIHNFDKINSPVGYRSMRAGYAIHRQFERSEKIYIAAVNGACMAGGFEIALCCDFIIASDSAFFSLPEVNLGLLPGWGGTVRLPRNLPIRKAKEVIMLGKRLSAAEAEKYGLVNKVVPLQELNNAVNELIDTLKTKSKLALGVIKSTINFSLDSADLDAALAIERGGISVLFGSEDCQEGVMAFFEKRKPNFQGK
jgi:enoyl-CoA hydratase/carnithine racemase